MGRPWILTPKWRWVKANLKERDSRWPLLQHRQASIRHIGTFVQKKIHWSISILKIKMERFGLSSKIIQECSRSHDLCKMLLTSCLPRFLGLNNFPTSLVWSTNAIVVLEGISWRGSSAQWRAATCLTKDSISLSKLITRYRSEQITNRQSGPKDQQGCKTSLTNNFKSWKHLVDILTKALASIV